MFAPARALDSLFWRSALTVYERVLDAGGGGGVVWCGDNDG